MTRMSNPNYWSKTKLAIMDEWREGNFEVEDPYNVEHYDLKEPVKKHKPDNILKFPAQNKTAEKQTLNYVIRVDLKDSNRRFGEDFRFLQNYLINNCIGFYKLLLAGKTVISTAFC